MLFRSRATADAAQYIYAKNVLMPRLRNREEAINKQLLPLFSLGEHYVWRFDSIIPYDKDFDKAKALDGWQSGLLMKNEARELLDLASVEGGDVYRASGNDLFLRATDDAAALSQATQQPEPAPAPEAEPAADKALTPSDDEFVVVEYGEKSAHRVNVSAALRKEDKIAKDDGKLFEEAVARHFSEQMTAISKALGLTAKAEPSPLLAPLDDYLLEDGTFDPELWALLSEVEQQRLTAGIAAGLLDWKAEAKKLTALFTPLWKKAYDDGAALNAESYGLIGIDRPDFVSAAKINGGKRIAGIEQTTRDSIADIIARGIANGVSQSELKKSILSEMDASPARAKLIARQETATALATGQFDMMRAAGAKTKTWHHRQQRNPRDGTNGKPNHVAMEGETVPMDAKFSNGLRYPRDPEDGRPEQLINCRCYLTYGGF